MAKITKRVVDAAEADPDGKDQFIWDAELKGFGLKVTPNGTKSYVLQYRTAEGRSRRYTIGKHGSPWTADDARGKASTLLRGLDAGIDPLETKAAAKAALTVKELVELYLRDGPEQKPNKKESAWNTDRSLFNRHILPLLGHRVIKTLAPADIAKFQAEVAAGKTAVVEKTKKQGKAVVTGGKGAAARSLSVLAATLNFGVKNQYITNNPAIGVVPFATKKMQRFLTDGEVVAIADGMATMIAAGRLSEVMANAIRLLALTGARKSDVRKLKWEFIDWQRSLLRFPDGKTGDREVKIGARALGFLGDLARHPTSEYVLPSPKKADAPILGIQKAWEKLRKFSTELAKERAREAGEPENRAPNVMSVRIHDLRHTFASFAASDGQSLLIIAKLLGHTQLKTTQIYAHLHDDPVRHAADRTAAHVADAFQRGTGQARPSAEVVEISSAKRKA